MSPPNPKAVAVALKQIVNFLATFGLLPNENRESIIDAYRVALETVPTDLLGKCVHAATIGLRYSRLPLPSDLIACVKDDLAMRQLVVLRLKTAELFAIEQEKRGDIAAAPTG